jgi:Zn-dependent protease
MLAGLFGYYLYQGASVAAAVTALGLVVAVFVCVILHEFGHALAARRFGIPTHDITMYPIGGIARLGRIPEKPREELLIALAGPAVNLAIAVLLFPIARAVGGFASMETVLQGAAGLLDLLVWVNLALVAFNMIPAFPMDGGRVLRAGLATALDYRRATHIASLLGQAIAVVMGIYGIVTFNVGLPFVAVFVIMAARQEVAYVMERT